MRKLKIITVIVFGLMIIALFILRAPYNGKDGLTSEELHLTGLENGIAVECGSSAGEIFISVPNSLEIEDVISVSSDINVAYLKLNKDEPYNERVIEAELVGLAPGIAEVYVRSPDGNLFSEKYLVNCIAQPNTSNNSEVSDTETAAASVPDEEIPENAVYVTPHGTKYHLSEKCAGDTAQPISLENAVAKGYQPCKRCAMK